MPQIAFTGIPPCHSFRALLLALPPVLTALLAYNHIESALNPWFNSLWDTCHGESQPGASWLPGAAAVADLLRVFHCLVVGLFREAAASEEGSFLWGQYCVLAAVLFAFMAVESSRLGTRLPLSLLPLFLAVWMFLGSTVGVALLWLPFYLLAGMPCTFSSPEQLKIPWQRVWAIWALNVVFFVGGVALLLDWKSPSMLGVFLEAVIWLTILCPLLWYLLPVSEATEASAGQLQVIQLHSFNAGLAVTSHLASLLLLVNDPSIVTKLLGLIKSHEGGASVAYMVMVDLAVTWLAVVYQVLVEGGLMAALLVIVTTPFLGIGGPVCFYYVRRELEIFKPCAHSCDACEDAAVPLLSSHA